MQSTQQTYKDFSEAIPEATSFAIRRLTAAAPGSRRAALCTTRVRLLFVAACARAVRGCGDVARAGWLAWHALVSGA